MNLSSSIKTEINLFKLVNTEINCAHTIIWGNYRPISIKADFMAKNNNTASFLCKTLYGFDFRLFCMKKTIRFYESKK